MPENTDIQERVARVLVEALNADESDIRPSATLQGNLGAESIDMLDIVFRLEREFDVGPWLDRYVDIYRLIARRAAAPAAA